MTCLLLKLLLRLGFLHLYLKRLSPKIRHIFPPKRTLAVWHSPGRVTEYLAGKYSTGQQPHSWQVVAAMSRLTGSITKPSKSKCRLSNLNAVELPEMPQLLPGFRSQTLARIWGRVQMTKKHHCTSVGDASNRRPAPYIAGPSRGRL